MTHSGFSLYIKTFFTERWQMRFADLDLNLVNYAIKPDAQEQLAENYIKQYFSPWVSITYSTLSSTAIKQQMGNILHTFQQTKGCGANGQLIRSSWLEKLGKNANVVNFPSLEKKAIILRDTQSRLLPTEEPYFNQWTAKGSDGYPFDRIQQSLIPANTPVLVQHISDDGSWYLVVTPSYYAWVKGQDLAFTSSDFIHQWQTNNYVVSTLDRLIAPPSFDFPSLSLRIGNIYSIKNTTNQYHEILIATNNSDNEAIIKNVKVPIAFLNPFPIPAKLTAIIELANQFLGKPYGWGGMYGYRDCSATTMDLMSPFGLWLPRNSGDQINTGTKIDLKGLSSSIKEKIIKEQGIPFLTLLHLPGHIGLYIAGEKEPHFLQNAWGYGGTVVTPLFAKDIDGCSYIDCIDSLTNLVSNEQII